MFGSQHGAQCTVFREIVFRGDRHHLLFSFAFCSLQLYKILCDFEIILISLQSPPLQISSDMQDDRKPLATA